MLAELDDEGVTAVQDAIVESIQASPPEEKAESSAGEHRHELLCARRLAKLCRLRHVAHSA